MSSRRRCLITGLPSCLLLRERLRVVTGRGVTRDVAHVRLERTAAAAGMVEVVHLHDGALALVEPHAGA